VHIRKAKSLHISYQTMAINLTLGNQGLKTRTACTTGITMQMDRRQMLQSAAAAIIAAPAASFASAGDFPKQAFFGAAPISAPFGDTYGQAGAPVWEKLQDTERAIYERILTDTKGHLKDVETFISKPSWDEATTELRLEMYETRKAMVRLSDVSENPVRFYCFICDHRLE
jgi:hypothetical protein